MTDRVIPPDTLERVIFDSATIERVAVALYGIHYNVDGSPARSEWSGLPDDIRELWRARATGALYEHLIDGRDAR